MKIRTNFTPVIHCLESSKQKKWVYFSWSLSIIFLFFRPFRLWPMKSMTGIQIFSSVIQRHTVQILMKVKLTVFFRIFTRWRNVKSPLDHGLHLQFRCKVLKLNLINNLMSSNFQHVIKLSYAGTGRARGATAPHLHPRTLFEPGRADYPHLLLLAPPKFFSFRHHWSWVVFIVL